MILCVCSTCILHVNVSTHGTPGGHFRKNSDFLKLKCNFWVKMTAKCPTSVEHTHTIILTHISPYFTQSRRELRSCQLLSLLHNSETVIFQFGPAVRSTDDISTYKVYIVLDNIIGIQKNHICANVALNHNELHGFESNMFFSVIRLLLVCFSVLIMYTSSEPMLA